MILMTSMHLLFNFKVEALFKKSLKSNMSMHVLSHIWATLSNSLSMKHKGYGLKIWHYRVIPVIYDSNEKMLYSQQ